MRILSLFCLLLAFRLTFAQTAEVDFNMPSRACINESILVENRSTEAERYEWDFCLNDLSADIAPMSKLTGVVGPNGISVRKANSTWYVFTVNASGIYRYAIGEKLANIPFTIEEGELIELEIDFDNLMDIELYREGEMWYALAIDRTNKMYLLNFNESLHNTPTIKELSSVATFLDDPLGIQIIQDDNSVFAIVANYRGGQLSVVNFGNSISNEPTVTNHAASSNIYDINLIMGKDGWYGIYTKWKSGILYEITFNNGLSNAPTISQLSDVFNSTGGTTGVVVAQEGGQAYGFVQTRNGGVFRADYSEQKVDTIINLGNANGTLQFIGSAIAIAKDHGEYYLFAGNSSRNEINILSFNSTCAASTSFSTEESPTVSFSEAGTRQIELAGIALSGDVNVSTREIAIDDSEAPVGSFSYQGDCVLGSTDFTLSIPEAITGSQWSFGDGSPPATGLEVTHQYTTPGTYEVTLEVESENGCGNRLTEEITIYEPPVPVFTAPAGQVCTNGAVTFTNTTDAKGADDIITYQWFVDGELVSEAANPAITFAEGGLQTVRLEAGIPGCIETVEQTVNVLQGPVVGFDVAQICQGDPISFENLTTGESITGYTWDFGDGGSFSSVAAENPTYTFTDAGAYSVTLTATNALGCENTYQRAVTVYEQPRVGFLSEVACVGSPTQFTDTTTAGTNANVIQWEWDFGDGLGTADERNPAYAYSQPGTYEVKLITQTTAGCVDSAFQTVTVVSPVEAGFSSTAQCTEDDAPYTLLLSDTSVVAGEDAIDRWFWTVNGENFVSSEVVYTFPGPGTYEVSLTAFAASGCNATVTRSVQVDSLPQLTIIAPEGCTGQPLAFQSDVKTFGQDITSYAWSFTGSDGENVGTAYEANPHIVFDEPGAYEATLTVQTADGCSLAVTQPLTIDAAPAAAFMASANFGGFPLEVTFDNTTTNATQFRWDFAGLDSAIEENPTFTFAEAGTYVVTLTASNASGCTATAQQTIEVVAPVQDLQLEEVTISESADREAQQVLLSISNQGTRVASRITATITLDEIINVQEQILQPVLPGETVVYPLRFQLPVNQRTAVRYLCVGLEADDNTFEEEDLENNRNCLSLNNRLNIEAPFPNPAHDQVRVSVILPTADAVSLQLMNQEGKVLRRYVQETTTEGLNTFSLPVKGLPAGAYLLTVTYQGEQRQFRVTITS